MNDLRPAIIDALFYASDERINYDSDPSVIELTDAVLRVLAEHGDTQQVRAEIDVRLANLPGGYVDNDERLRVDHPVELVVDAVMAVVAPILAGRDAALERANDAAFESRHQTNLAHEAEGKRKRAEADLATARQQLGQVRALHFNEHDHCAKCSDLWPCREAAILDAPARPAGHDETGQ